MCWLPELLTDEAQYSGNSVKNKHVEPIVVHKLKHSIKKLRNLEKKKIKTSLANVKEKIIVPLNEFLKE